MKFIIDTFDKELIFKLAFFLHGEIVNPNESLVIVDYPNEMGLHNEVERIIKTDNFIIKEQTIEWCNSTTDHGK